MNYAVINDNIDSVKYCCIKSIHIYLVVKLILFKCLLGFPPDSVRAGPTIAPTCPSLFVGRQFQF